MLLKQRGKKLLLREEVGGGFLFLFLISFNSKYTLYRVLHENYIPFIFVTITDEFIHKIKL